ncbi:MAG: PAS domain-containing protein [Methanobrevibacter sp.]|uniref:histidine kinase dimerization/phosphoacceptor domain -containing protein n=1 Tax=Methanobrevibacter sp. TaxID=66852 RepID=UPI001B1F9DB6|nr:histidine kinase dimerization/phosphoacceptor domain -containing protein [Methanobrevibacter sp.]MBO5150553.1 PAS domain-containing protein [Methanobrevibacter sp.]
MRVKKEHMLLEDIDEIRIYDATPEDLYNPTPKEFDVEDIKINELFNNIPFDINTFIPHDGGKDFIIQGLGRFTLKIYDCAPEDVEGRLLSKLSPPVFDILYDYLSEVNANHSTKEIRFAYYNDSRLTNVSTVNIIYDMERIFVVTDNVDTTIPDNEKNKSIDKDKSNMMENFSQTGSYYLINGKYSWSHGIYNIINRKEEKSDTRYNIVFELVIPDDKHIVDEIFEASNREVSQWDEIFRIKTPDGKVKVIEVDLNSYFDERGRLIRQGWINDITPQSPNEFSKPVDFLLNGFTNSTKLALLIEPLNKKQYKFSKGFYYLIEKNYEDYDNSGDILENIAEKEVVEKIKKLYAGEISEISEIATYNVDGNPKNSKIVDLYIERFEYNDEVHSLGFLTEITEEIEKQNKLIESNELKVVLIKEIHHRVKNNLQVLNSFLNLEKRAYKNNPDMIIKHMQTRLTSLALLHEKTYNTEDFKNINLKEYMMDFDRKTEQFIEIPGEVEFETQVDEDLNLSIEVITPLILVINELTTNAMKHAFPDENMKNKKITKDIRRLDDDRAVLIMKDNGVGIKDVKNVTKSLGCEIIKSLTKQLDGTISLIESENGTAYKLVFPIHMDHTIY